MGTTHRRAAHEGEKAGGRGPLVRELALPPDFGVRLRDVSPLHLDHSRDDPELPFGHLERYHRELPHAVVRPLDGRGHEFDQTEFPELVADILRVTAVKRARMV